MAQLTSDKMDCIRLMLEGLKIVEISEKINVHRNTITAWKREPEFKAEYDRQLRESISAAVPEALKTMFNLLKSNNEFVRAQAAKDLLDRGGMKAIEKIEAVNKNENITKLEVTADEIADIKANILPAIKAKLEEKQQTAN